MTIHRVDWIEAIGSRVRLLRLGRGRTLTFSPRYGSSWLPAFALFIETFPMVPKTAIRDSYEIVVGTLR